MSRNCLNCKRNYLPKNRKINACKICDEGMSEWAPRPLSDIRKSCRLKKPHTLDGSDAKKLERELTRVEQELKSIKQTDDTERLIKDTEMMVDFFDKLISNISTRIYKIYNPINESLCELRASINEYKTRVESTQRVHRLSIALFQLFDVTDVDEIWSRGLISRDRYDALSWEFNRINDLTFSDRPKWNDKNQYGVAMRDIMNEYREYYQNK